MVKAGGFDEPPFDTDAVHDARKAACTEPTALPGVRWLLGASSEARWRPCCGTASRTGCPPRS